MIVPSTDEARLAKQRDVEAAKVRQMDFKQFEFVANLDMDNYGTFLLAKSEHPPRICAVKVFKKQFVIENDEIGQLRAARNVGMTMDREKHPFLIRFFGSLQTQESAFLVMEYCAGGNLMHHLQRGQFQPEQTKLYAAEVCLGLKFLHEHGVLHRDVQADHIWLAQDGHIKIADYGLCKENVWHESRTTTFCGTAPCMAPEILLDKKYGRPVDWWSFGILLYQMVLHQVPFRGEDEDEIYDAILADDPVLPPHLSESTAQILKQLLVRDPEKRLGSGHTDAQEIMDHAYFHDIVWDDVLHKRVQPFFVPTVTSDTDTSNFDSEFTTAPLKLSATDSSLDKDPEDEFRDFDYVADFA